MFECNELLEADDDDGDDDESVVDYKQDVIPRFGTKQNNLNVKKALTESQNDGSIEDQVLSLAKSHAQKIAQIQADEKTQSISQPLLKALNSKTDEEEERKRNAEVRAKLREIEEEQELKRLLKEREDESKREASLRDERMLQDKAERERERERMFHPPSLEELIQSLALTHAEQQVREQTQKQAQTVSQKLVRVLYTKEGGEEEVINSNE